jgi:hypothetical protein
MFSIGFVNFSGAEFALIPSRDEPFGLVAVEFGRKGALGIGGISLISGLIGSKSWRTRTNAGLVVHYRVDDYTTSPSSV